MKSTKPKQNSKARTDLTNTSNNELNVNKEISKIKDKNQKPQIEIQNQPKSNEKPLIKTDEFKLSKSKLPQNYPHVTMEIENPDFHPKIEEKLKQNEYNQKEEEHNDKVKDNHSNNSHNTLSNCFSSKTHQSTDNNKEIKEDIKQYENNTSHHQVNIKQGEKIENISNDIISSISNDNITQNNDESRFDIGYPQENAMNGEELNHTTIDFIDDDSDENDNNITEHQSLLDFTEEMDKFKIPHFLQKTLLMGAPKPPILHLRNWQKQLFSSTHWENGENIIVRVPTAGGKTIAAEVAIAQTLEKDSNSKILYLVPFVALASEKFSYFSTRFPDYSVRGFYQNVGGSEFLRGSIGVCTYERANSLINSSLKKDYFDDFKLVIIDEIHMLGDEKRGATIESIIIKCMLPKNKPRIIGLSATISDEDIPYFSSFMDCFVFTYQSESGVQKHTNVQQYIKTYDGDLFPIENGEIIENDSMHLKSIDQDRKQVLPLIVDALNEKGNIIYFVNTKKESEINALLIANHITKEPSKDLASKRRELCKQLHNKRKERFAGSSSSKDDQKESKAILFMINRGVCYHHAGLLLEERKIIERGFREGLLSVIVATTTLSAGVDFSSVSLVIIDNVYRTCILRGVSKTVGLQTSQYVQMSGRAGRTDTDKGKAVIIQNTRNSNEVDYIKMLSLQKLEKITTHLLNDEEFDKFLLHIICFMTDIIKIEDFSILASKTYQFISEGKANDKELANSIINQSIDRLKAHNLLNELNKATQIGLGISSANMSIKDGLRTYKNLQQMDNSLNLADSIHLMILCIPEDCDDNYPYPSYANHIWSEIFGQHKEVMEKNFGITSDLFERISIQSVLYGKIKKHEISKDNDKIESIDPKRQEQQNLFDLLPEIDHILKKMYCAAILVDMIEGNSIYYVESRYQFSRGNLENLQNQTLTYCTQIIKLCSVCDFVLLENILISFRKSIIYCVSNELLPVMSIPQCTQSIARKLFNVGLMSPNDVLLLSINDIANILQYGTTKNQQRQTNDTIDDNQLTEENIETATAIRKGADLICAKETQLEELSQNFSLQ